MTTGQLIKIARKNAGITQSELAQRLNIPFQSVSQWERDLRNPKYETICRIAAALDVEFADLVPQEVGGKMIVDHVLGRLKNLSTPIERTTRDMSQMTQEGQEKVADYAEDILPRYRRQEPAQPPAQKTVDSTDGTDTPAAQDAPEGAEEAE